MSAWNTWEELHMIKRKCGKVYYDRISRSILGLWKRFDITNGNTVLSILLRCNNKVFHNNHARHKEIQMK